MWLPWPTVSFPFSPQLLRTERFSEPYPTFLQVPSQLPLLTHGECPLEPAHIPSLRAQTPGQPRSSLPPELGKQLMPGLRPRPPSLCPPLVRLHSIWALRAPLGPSTFSPHDSLAWGLSICLHLLPFFPIAFAPDPLCHVPSVWCELMGLLGISLQRELPQSSWASYSLDPARVTSNKVLSHLPDPTQMCLHYH